MFDPLDKTPPGNRAARSVQWADVEGRSFEAVIPQGMQIAYKLEPYYMAICETVAGWLTAGKTLSEFAVVTFDGEIVASGHVDPESSADDIAWLSCMFMELMQGRLAWVVPR